MPTVKKTAMVYMYITALVNKKVDIAKDTKRDELPQAVLMDIAALERVLAMKLPKLITGRIYYKDVYQEIKKLVDNI